MIVRQLLHTSPVVGASYVVACGGKQAAATELASSAEEGARSLFESAERLRALPGHVQVMRGAFAGSVCGRGLSATPFSTLGFERRFNRAFALTERDGFIEHMLREIAPRPSKAAETRAANRGRDLARVAGL